MNATPAATATPAEPVTPVETEPSFAVEEYVEPTPAPPAHTPLVQALIDLGPDKVAKFNFKSEDDALSALKSWQAAARFLNVAVKRVSVTGEGKGKDATVALRVRIGQRVTRQRKSKDETAEQTAEQSPAE